MRKVSDPNNRFAVKILLTVFLFLAVFFCASCGKETAKSAPKENEYDIYYLDNEQSALSAVNFTADTKDTEGLVKELTAQLLKAPDAVDVVVALPDQVSLQGYKLNENILTLNFDGNYSSIKPARMVLCNAAFAKTLTQIKGVEYVSFNSGDQPLRNSDGKPLGALSGSDFVQNITNVNSYEKKELVLYFADASGTRLKEEKREAIYNMDTSLEQLVVTELIKGPETEGLKATISPDAKLLNVSVNEGICYINFNQAFLTTVKDTDVKLTVYSIVDSLSELTTVKKVQIAVEGSQKATLGDTLSLDKLFERDLDYIETEG